MGKKKMFGILALLCTLLILPIVFSSNLAGMVGNLFSSNPAPSASTSSTTKVIVDPVRVLDSRLQASNASKFIVNVNISSVSDLFAWQINMTWNASILSVNRIIAGDFLSQTTSKNKTSSASRYYGGLGFVINVTDNAKGRAAMSESILEDALPGSVPGISGEGKLVSIEFLVLDYGCTGLNISLTGNLRTMLLNSAGGEIPLAPGDVVNGYFRNKIKGDANGDKTVDIFDILKVKNHWYPGPPVGAGGYERNIDINDDRAIDIFDVLEVKNNWGRSL